MIRSVPAPFRQNARARSGLPAWVASQRERGGGEEKSARREETEWFSVVAWDKLGEIVSQYLTRGRRVYVEGRLQTRQYDDKEGQRRYFTEVVAQDVQFLDGSEAKAQQAESLFEDTNVA